jgi:hypothetical protein
MHPIRTVERCTFGQRRSSGHDNVSEQRLPEVHIRPTDSIYNDLVDTGILQTDELGVKQDLRSPEPLGAKLHANSQSRLGPASPE